MIQVDIEGISLALETHPKLFSPRKPDPGTMAMLSFIEFSDDDRILDLGCGYGIVGLYAAKVTTGSTVVLSDNDSLAIEYARRNRWLSFFAPDSRTTFAIDCAAST